MRSSRLAIAALIAGCHGQPAPTAPTPDNEAPEAPAPARPGIAALFVDGASWKFDVEYTSGGYDEHDQWVEDVEHLALWCGVARVETHDGVSVSEIECDEAWPTVGGEMPLRGEWTKTSRGYWIGDPQGEPTIAVPPVAWEVADRDPDTGDTISKTSLSESDGGWCWEEQYLQGDSSWSKLCFDADGPHSGTYGWSGGSEYATSFTVQ